MYNVLGRNYTPYKDTRRGGRRRKKASATGLTELVRAEDDATRPPLPKQRKIKSDTTEVAPLVINHTLPASTGDTDERNGASNHIHGPVETGVSSKESLVELLLTMSEDGGKYLAIFERCKRRRRGRRRRRQKLNRRTNFPFLQLQPVNQTRRRKRLKKRSLKS